MASKLITSWGASVLLLAATIGCSSGSATPTCPMGTSLCNGMCTNTLMDAANCGVCGNVCPANASLCSQGTCAASCAATQKQCGSACTDTQSDKFNCGNCGVTCSGTQTCNAGVCVGGPTGVGGAATGVGGNASVGGGTAQGGSATGNGGSGQGGAATNVGGNTSKGGATGNGGSGQGGATTNVGGGTAKGGASTGGAATNNGGTTSTGGTVNTGSVPAGWWTSWKTADAWKGCAWAAIGAESNTATTITAPASKDYTGVPNGGPYTLTGSVGGTWESVTILGFNLAEDPATANCAYSTANSTKSYPGVTMPAAATGIALNFSKTGAFTLRIQIQGPDGNFDANQRWCQTITAVNGKAFAPFDKFNTKCWVSENPTSTEAPGVAFNKTSQISAIAFTVPGTLGQATPYNFTINGFTAGTQASDAPDGGGPAGPLTGTIGGAGDINLDFQRVKVSKDGEEYIIQNNNWGNPQGTNQTLSFSDNSFKITGTTGAGPGGGVPASFPSIYIGNNGNTANGMSTKGTDNLPKQVSTITSIQTTLTWTGTCGSGFNTSYDVWFAASPPTSEYQDAISGFVMVWLCDPSDAQPIGSVQRSATIAGNTWDVWVGPRGGSGSNSGAPVVSYVRKNGAINTLTFNLKDFITDAATNGIQSSWYLTDVFGGFEIWNGGSTNGLAVTNFTCVVQ